MSMSLQEAAEWAKEGAAISELDRRWIQIRAGKEAFWCFRDNRLEWTDGTVVSITGHTLYGWEKVEQKDPTPDATMQFCLSCGEPMGMGHGVWQCLECSDCVKREKTEPKQYVMHPCCERCTKVSEDVESHYLCGDCAPYLLEDGIEKVEPESKLCEVCKKNQATRLVPRKVQGTAFCCEACFNTQDYKLMDWENREPPTPTIEEWPIEWKHGRLRASTGRNNEWICLGDLDSVGIEGRLYRLFDYKYEKDGEVVYSRETGLLWNKAARVFTAQPVWSREPVDTSLVELVSPKWARMVRE